LQTKIYCINDSYKPQKDCWIRLVIYDNAGERSIYQEGMEVGDVEANSRKIMDYKCRISSNLPTGNYKIGVFLYGQKKIVSNNYYRIYVVNRKNLPSRIESKANIALYDIAGALFGMKGTKDILDNLKIKYTHIKNFSNFDNYQVLIIGANSIDTNVMKAGNKITEWIEKGGRLLSFEQIFAGEIPWCSNYTIAEGLPGAFVDTLDCRHPVYNNLKQENFDTWNGKKGVIFKSAIMPIDETVVASGAYAAYSRDKEAIQMTVHEFRLGRGTALHSQIEATDRYGEDSAATRYIQNVLNYVLTMETTGSVTSVKPKKAKIISPEECVFVDLAPYVNRSFTDEIKDDKKGGWDDSGNNDLRKMPTGRQVFNGIPFEVIDPARNSGKSCIVLKGSERDKKDFLPRQVTRIRIDKKVKSLYFLHTATYCPRSVAIAKYIIHYEDGTKIEKELLSGKEIADWWSPRNLEKAKVAFCTTNPYGARVGIYAMKWNNPYIMKRIKSIDFISEEKAVPILVAITGRELQEVLEPE